MVMALEGPVVTRSEDGPSQKISVVVADEQPLMRAGLGMLLTVESNIEVVAEAATGVGAVVAAREWSPEVAIVDGLIVDGLDATRELTDMGVSVLVLTGHCLDAVLYGALRAGATGLLLKSTARSELVQAIRAVAAGDGWLDPAVTRMLMREFASRAEPGARTPQELSQLTGREREVLIMVAHGFTNREIAERLFIQEGTVKAHIGRVLTKLRLRDRAQAVAAAYQNGLVVVEARR